MNFYRLSRKFVMAASLAAVVVFSCRSGIARDGREDHDEDATEAMILKGLEVAPVPLNLNGRSIRRVGLGSYIVNVHANCNDCHDAGPTTQFVPGGNPFFGQHPAVTNPATYLGGGRSFGSLVPGSPEIVSRNLTPDKLGRTLGGDSFEMFVRTMRTGRDPDHVHPTCGAGVTTNCLPPPFDGELLQIMPWPSFHDMTTQDLRAIYEYLGAIPCVEGGPNQPANRCH
jgi:hypothetical protein